MNKNLSLEDLIESFLERYRTGDAPDIDTFAKEHPEQSDRLLELLPLVLKMESLGGEKTQKIQALTSSDSALPDLTGSDFRLQRRIGAGGMGVVFEAKQISLNRNVAVKLLSPSLIADSSQRELFENEARIIARLHHPNIIKVLSAGRAGDRSFYAMELIDGKGLNQYTFTGLREIAEIGLQVAKALAYAHRCNVLHRDIKPSNLLLDARHEVHVGDFGLAFVLKDTSEREEGSGPQSGTIRYMPPERLLRGENTFAGDQYSFGITLYEWVTQRPILAEKDPQEWVRRIGSEPLPELNCKEKDLAAIINRCIQFLPQHRYPDMDSVAEDLQHFLNHEPVRAANPSVFRKVFLWTKRRPLTAAAGLSALVALIAFITALAFGYIRTKAALKLAERNAATADATLSDIFAYVERQPPTASGSALLSRLMPYYQEIAGQRNLPKTQMSKVHQLIGTAALRSGNNALAETAFRSALELEENAFLLNQLAEALRQQGKKESSESVSKKILEKYPESYEAVRAARASGQDHAAFEQIRKLLQKDPRNPDYRFQYALLLGMHPDLFRASRIAGVEPHAPILLNTLAKEYPDRPEYGLALVDLMRRKLRYTRNLNERDRQEIDLALHLSDRLLGRFSNMPGVVSSVVEFRHAVITAFRRNGDLTSGRKETERLQGMLEILFHNPETPDSVKEYLIRLQLDQLSRMGGEGPAEASRHLKNEIRFELESYHGPQKEKFERQIGDNK